jgi:hypothetical protein
LQLEHTPLLHVPEPQFVQAWPKRPHCCAVCWPEVTHTLPTQQPLLQVAALHTHAPNWQVEPAGQGAPLPHAHRPWALHESVVCGSHARHAEPATPHALSERARHVGPEQQPFGQLVAVQLLHTPPSHVPLPGHVWHWRPAEPHAAALFPARH